MIVYRELSSLEQDLGFSARTLYAVSNSLDKHYRTATIPKKSGGVRKLRVPDELLKAIQHQITEVLILPRPISRYAKAYYPGSSTVRNAKHHVGQSVVLKLDILHFFDSIRYSDVKDLVFPSEIYAEPLRILLTMLCYHKDALPQGAPSSPAITNVIMAEFDEIVGRHCDLQGIRYTRYCDDMTFSGDFDPNAVIAFVRQELKKRGFLLNEQKTRIQCSGTRQSVTGIVVNEKLSIPADYRRKLRQELHYVQKYGVTEHLRRIESDTPEEIYLQQLLGKVNYVLQVSPDEKAFQKARRWLKECPYWSNA